MTMREGPIVTIDGPAGSGKSSTAKEVARVLHFRHLDSGALYRALTLALTRAEVPQSRWPHLSEADLNELDVEIEATDEGFTVLVDGSSVEAELRTPEITEGVSHLAKQPAVRARLMGLQQRAGQYGRLVAEGRDMGTVVFPDAEVKVYLVADVAERARRRLLDEGATPDDATAMERQIGAIRARDKRDSEREVSPLKKADDAHEIDTTGLSFDEQVMAVVQLVRRLTAS